MCLVLTTPPSGKLVHCNFVQIMVVIYFYVSHLCFTVLRPEMECKKHSRNWSTRYYRHQDYTLQTHPKLVKALALQTVVAMLVKLRRVVGVRCDSLYTKNKNSIFENV